MAEKKEKKIKSETPKRGRGRPRKSTAKLEKTNNEITKLFDDKSGQLLKNEEFENKISNTKINIKSDLLSENLSVEEFTQDMTIQISTLDDTLKLCDQEFQSVSQKLKKTAVIKEQLLNDRIQITSLIEQHQNLIFKYENDLESLSDTHYTAERPEFMRVLLRILGFQDEIYLREQIARSETLISQWKRKLVDICQVLSNSLIAYQGHEQVLETVSSVRESYRNIRTNLGKTRRKIQLEDKSQKTLNEQNRIIQDYLENVNKLTEVGPNFADSMEKNSKIFADLVSQRTGQHLLNSSFGSFPPIKNEINIKSPSESDKK